MVKTKAASKVKKKPADFKRPKRKVGRKAPQAANVTSVAISSRRINMLEQSVLQEKGDAVTHRNLSLQDLMQQMGHYNAHIRQRALQGLRELVVTHASNVLANVSVVLERFLPMVVDEEAIVRDAAVSTWKVLAPALVAGKSLTPFAKLIAVYFCSGLTHLQIGVRHDTLRAIGALLEVAPELISVDAGLEQLGRLIENFRDLIAATQAQGIKVTNSYDLLAFKKSSTSSSNASGGNNNDASATAPGGSSSGGGRTKKTSAAKAGALTLRFAALKVLHRLLVSIDFSAATGAASTAVRRTRSLQTSTQRTAPVGTVSAVLLYPTPVLVTRVGVGVGVGSSSRTGMSDPLSSVGFWQDKSRSLLQPLLDLWVECVGGDSDDVDALSGEYVEHMQYVIESVTVVLAANRTCLASAAAADDALCRVARRLQDTLLQRFPLFPAHNIVHSGDAYLSTWYGINVALAKFACVFFALPAASAVQSTHQSTQLLESRVLAFVGSTLAKYEASDELRSLSGTHVIVRALLEVVTLLLHAQHSAVASDAAAATRQHELLACVTALYVKTSPKSVTFRTVTAFVLAQLGTLAKWPAWDVVMQWLACFGQLLARLELAHVVLGRECLFAMISVLKQLPAEFATEEQLAGIMANLVDFFSVAPPAATATVATTPSVVGSALDGTKKVASNKQLTQFDALSADDQMQFIALIYHVPRYPVALLRALASCCKSDRVAFSAKSFVMDMLLQRRECVDMAHFVSFLMSSVLARQTSSTIDSRVDSVALAVATQRADALHLQLVHHVCHILHALQLGATLAQILAPTLARHVGASFETMSRADVHTLVLLYRVCFASASSTRGVVSNDVPREMEQQALALALHVMLGSAAASPSAAELEHDDRALVADVVELLTIHDAIFIALMQSLIGADNAVAVAAPDALAKRLRVLQRLARTAQLAARFVQHQQMLLALLQSLDAAVQSDSLCSPAMKDDVSRLIRQLEGDLQLVAVGASN